MFGDQRQLVKVFFIILIHLIIPSTYYCQASSTNVDGNFWQKTQLFQYSRFQRVDKKRSASHEAGHILVAYLLGLKITRASITSSKNNDGYVNFVITNFTPPEKIIMVYLAGYMAEEIIYGKACYGIRGDLEKASKIILDSNLKDQPLENLKNIFLKTKEIFLQNLALLEYLAQQLLKQQTLTGNQINQIINSFLMHPMN